MLLLTMALAGGLLGGGVFMIVRGAVGPRATIGDVMTDLHRPRITVAASESKLDELIAATVGRGSDRHQADLDICERSTSKFAVDRLVWSLIFALPGLLLVLLAPVGVELVPVAVAYLAVLAGAVAGWFFSMYDLRTDAEKKRREFRHSLAAYLELVTILLAGGAGTQGAVFDAAALGRGSAFRHIKSALSQAQARRETPWATLGALGRRLDVVQLVELEQTMTLAGDGARVKDSLRAKAEAMRDRDRSEMEAEAERKSESMVLPVAMMFAGGLLLFAYPALQGLAAPA